MVVVGQSFYVLVYVSLEDCIEDYMFISNKLFVCMVVLFIFVL